jgi:hypothetical protein
MGASRAQVGEDGRVGTPGLLQSIGENGEAGVVEVSAREQALVVCGSGQGGDRWGKSKGRPFDWAVQVGEQLLHESVIGMPPQQVIGR